MFATTQDNRGGAQKATKNQQHSAKAIKLDFAPGESVTSFGGLAVAARVFGRLGLRALLEKRLPHRRGYRLPQIATAALAGMLTGAQGTVATEAVRPARPQPPNTSPTPPQRPPSQPHRNPRPLAQRKAKTYPPKIQAQAPRRKVALEPGRAAG